MFIVAWACIVGAASRAVEALPTMGTKSIVVPDFGEAGRESHGNRPLNLPQVALADLAENVPAAVVAARTALSELGALVVVGVEDSSLALQAWVECLQAGGAARMNGTVAQRALADGFVRRASVFAKERWGADRPAARFASCPAAVGYEDDMRQGVRTATQALALALETNSGDGDGDISLATAVLEGEHLEHLHLYQEARNRQRGFGKHQALEMHTDAGALLAFVPPIAARTSKSSYLEVEGTDGTRYDLAPFPSNSVVFFVGQTSRLLSRRNSQSPFRPVPHALSLPLGFSWRAWYGVMILIPHDTLVHPDPTAPGSAISFRRLWEGARSHIIELGNGSASMAHDARIGCGAGLVLVDQAGSCSEGTIACWMQCMSIKGELETCKDYSWASSGHGDMAAKAWLKPQCREPNTGKKYPEETGNMCPSCKPVCTINVNASMPMPSPTPGAGDYSFCNSQGTDVGSVMYMDGFRWTAGEPSAACLGLFFGSWIIDAPWKLSVSCVVVASLGILMEMISLTRRQLPARRQRDIGYVFHGANLFLAYLVMLVIMMYSIELFLSVLVGLVIGHIVSTKIGRRIVTKRQMQNPSESVNECVCPPEDVPDAGAHSACCRIALGLDATTNSMVHTAEADAYLDIKGMTCISCSSTVKGALLSVDGVVNVEVSLATNVARVGFNPPANAVRMCEAVESVGFEASDRAQSHSEEPPLST